MAESTLIVVRDDLKRAVARYIGISRDDTLWSQEDLDTVNDIIKSGENMFYRPSPLPGERGAHQWSFLQPEGTLETVADTSDYVMPDDFGGFIENQLAFTRGDGAWYPVMLTSYADIQARKMSEQEEETGFPLFGAEFWNAPDQGAAHKKTLTLWPTPDAIYTLRYRYWALPNTVSEADPYPLGNQPHAETLRQAVLAAAELEHDGMQGPHYQEFLRLLTASISFDRQTRAKFVGNANLHNDTLAERHGRDYITYNGVLYAG